MSCYVWQACAYRVQMQCFGSAFYQSQFFRVVVWFDYMILDLRSSVSAEKYSLLVDYCSLSYIYIVLACALLV